jgi:integrase
MLDKLHAAQRELLEQGDIITDSPTVDEWMTFWLRNVTDVRPRVWTNYESLNRVHISPTIGRVKLDRLTTTHIRKVHAHCGAPSSNARNAHMMLSKALGDAVRDGKLLRNPMTRVDAPKAQKAALEALTVEEAVSVVRKCVDAFHAETYDPGPALWSTYLLTGTRRGEVLGLEWDRVGDVLDLSWQLQQISDKAQFQPDFEYRHLKGTYYLTRPKTSTSWRIIPLVEPLRSILANHKARNPEIGSGLVFTTMLRPSPIDPSKATRLWNEFRPTVTAKKVRLHDLRHTTVDLLYEAGVPEDVIQEIVGHSTRNMTRHYKAKGNRARLTDAMTQLSTFLELN